MASREVFVELTGYMLPYEEAWVASIETVDGEWFGAATPRMKN